MGLFKTKTKLMTSIEWLIDQLIPEDQHEGIMDIIEDAKDRHKQEIIDAYKKGQALGFDDNPNYMAEQYYQETFVSKGSAETPMERKLLKSCFVDIVPKQETLYTEEQVMEAMLKVINCLVGRELSLAQLKESIIQSLKKHKQ